MSDEKSPLATTAEVPVHAAGTGRRLRVFSGIQPTGGIHLGNWLGAVRTWKRQVDEGTEDTMYCIVDAHAITMPYEGKDLRANIDAYALDLVALGLDPEKTTLFVQSDVREHTELAWYLAAVTPYGELGRMTQFKEKGEGQGFVSTALFTYPILMTADILAYKAEVVPVGEDQLQHLELARETVRRFNHRFGRVFREPKARLSATPRIMGLDGEGKMSKSKGNTIGVFEPKEDFWNKLRTSFTDPQRLMRSDPGRPEVCNIYTMHKAVSPEETQKEVYENCTGAKWGCVDCKKVLMDNMDKELVPLRDKRASLDAGKLRQALGDGASKARVIAQETLREVRDVMGLGSLAR